MPAPDLFAPFLKPLEGLGFPYCITGSVAASVYGEPRLTADIDIVLLLQAADIGALRAAFPEHQYYVPSDETLYAETAHATCGSFNLIFHDSQFKAAIYLAGQDPLHAWALANRRRINLGDFETWIAPPEYVILRKLEFLREGGHDKHIRDIRHILAIADLNRPFLDDEIARRGLRNEWLRCAPAAAN